jgi:hypothetical protein
MKPSSAYQVGDKVSGTFLGSTEECKFAKVAGPIPRSLPVAGEIWEHDGKFYEPTLGFQNGETGPEFNATALGEL